MGYFFSGVNVKSFTSVVANPTFLRTFHGWCTLFWLPFTFLAYWLGWLESVTFVSLVSMVSLFLGSFSSWQASRTEYLQTLQMEQDSSLPDPDDTGFLTSPKFLRAFHGWSTLFWLPFTALAYYMGWLESVTFVSVVSMLALFLGSFSSWQASRTEVIQFRQMQADDNDYGDELPE